MDLAQAKERAAAEVERRATLLLGISRDLHAHPELAFEEHHAHRVLTDVLADEGLTVERSSYGLDTAFSARAGAGGPTIAVMCEYDALPAIGHACGHNVIAAAGLGAGLAAAALAAELGGSVVVLGTPAEEGGGGKVEMTERGALDGIDAAMMIHPADADLDAMCAIAINQLQVEYRGQAAHAAAFPELGRNALDAAVLGYMNVAALRQHIGPLERVHGVFTSAGDRPNIVPKYTAQHWYIRSDRLAGLEPLGERVLGCLRAGAIAAGCEFGYEWTGPVYADMVDNQAMVGAFTANAGTLGRTLRHGGADGVIGSTDMGNVSYAVPSIHPMLAVAPAGISIHSPEFARHAGGAAGDRAVIDGAKAMAMTIVDLWLCPDLLESARTEFSDTLRKES